MWHENHAAYCPLRKVVVQDEKIGSAVAEDRTFHLGVCGVNNFAAEGFGLAFQLKGRLARWTIIVDGGVVSCGRLQSRGVAGWAEEIDRAPGFGTDSGALRGALVTC